jgi:hypothetical protein
MVLHSDMDQNYHPEFPDVPLDLSNEDINATCRAWWDFSSHLTAFPC